MENAKHTHTFFVDTQCDCGMKLSTYTREITKLNADLVAALDKFMTWLDEGLLVRDITKDAASEWGIKMMHFVNDLNKARAAVPNAKWLEWINSSR
jgi:hypothetical protein